MKKILSVLLSVMMVAGLFVALIPTAAAKPATMAEPGLLVYSEDFEGDNLTEKTDNTLTQELGWVQWNDSGECTVEGYMNGLNGRGVASIVEANGSTAIQMTYKGQGGVGTAYGDSYGWGVQVVENDRLAGGDYIIDYTATIVSETDSAARGIGWRNNRCYGYDKDWITEGATAANTGATYHVQIKSTGAYDMHLKATNGTTYSTADSSSGSLGNIVGTTYTYRTVVSSTEGIHTYVWKNGEWTYYFGMNAAAITQFGKDASNIGAGLILRVCQGVTVNFDDIAVYTIKDENTPTVNMVGFQTTVAENDRYDLRVVGTISALPEDLESIAFDISVNGGKKRTVYLHYVYEAISTNFGSDTFDSPEGGYVVALEINDCPIDASFAISLRAIYEDGASLTSNSLAFWYGDKKLNKIDQAYIEKAIQVLSQSTYTGLTFAKHAYSVAFSQNQAITSILSGTPDEMMEQVVSPAEALAPAIVYTAEDTVIATDLISGDLLLVKANDATKLYMVCADTLFDITATAAKADTATVLASLDTAQSYGVVRPSLTMTAFTPSNPNETPEEMTAYQEALVKTAEAFLLRGESLQYEDVWYGLTSTSGEHRWTHGEKAPEEYTTDEWGYVNCAVFTYDVYKNALGYELPNKMYTTSNLAANAETLGMLEYHFENATPDGYSEEYMAQVKQELLSVLEIGDLIVVRRSDSSGHVVMYVGNGRFIHSSGSSFYKDSDGVGHEAYEPTVRYQKINDYFFNPTSVRGYPFRGSDEYGTLYVKNLYVIRPLNAFEGDIPENTVARLENMENIRAEKTSSHPSSVSVNPGEEITFTFSLLNVGKITKTIEILDKAPAGTTYVSGCNDVSGDQLRWTVTVGAGETVTVSYVVRVNETAADGTLIDGTDATVGGVAHRCAAIRVKRTLTADEQAAIKNTIETIKSEGTTLTGLELVNKIYADALGKENLFADTNAENVMRDGEESIFVASTVTNGTGKYLSKLRTDETYYSSMLVDHLYGGIRFDSSEKLYDRTKLLKPHNLVVGDVLIARTSSAVRIYFYAGDGTLLNLTEGMGDPVDFMTQSERIMYYGRDFAVVRPSYVMD